MRKPVLPLNSTNIECGTCNKALAESSTAQDKAFQKICTCCNNQRFLHPKCAKKHFYSVTLEMSQDYVTKPSTTIIKNTFTPKKFGTCLIPYYYMHCRNKKCFVCGVEHSPTDQTLDLAILLWIICHIQ